MPPQQQQPQYPPQQQPQWPPQQPQTQTPSEDPYGFIMSPEKPQRPRRSLGNPMGLLFIFGAVAVVIVLIVIILSVVRGGGGNTDTYKKLVQEQQEIVRVANLQNELLQQENAKNFVMNTLLTMQSDKVKLHEYLGKIGIKVSKKELIALKDKDTDTQLDNAVTNHTLDAVMVETLQSQLTDYQSTLSTAYKSSTNKTTKTLLVELNDHAKLLIAQSKQ